MALNCVHGVPVTEACTGLAPDGCGNRADDPIWARPTTTDQSSTPTKENSTMATIEFTPVQKQTLVLIGTDQPAGQNASERTVKALLSRKVVEVDGSDDLVLTPLGVEHVGKWLENDPEWSLAPRYTDEQPAQEPQQPAQEPAKSKPGKGKGDKGAKAQEPAKGQYRIRIPEQVITYMEQHVSEKSTGLLNKVAEANRLNDNSVRIDLSSKELDVLETGCRGLRDSAREAKDRSAISVAVARLRRIEKIRA